VHISVDVDVEGPGYLTNGGLQIDFDFACDRQVNDSLSRRLDTTARVVEASGSRIVAKAVLCMHRLYDNAKGGELASATSALRKHIWWISGPLQRGDVR
jgi:hypothetical protein